MFYGQHINNRGGEFLVSSLNLILFYVVWGLKLQLVHNYVGKVYRVYRFIVTQQMKSAIDSCYTHMPFMFSCMGIAGVNNAVDPMT